MWRSSKDLLHILKNRLHHAATPVLSGTTSLGRKAIIVRVEIGKRPPVVLEADAARHLRNCTPPELSAS
jgi:hypothetical protein